MINFFKKSPLAINMIAQIIALLVNFGVTFFLTPLIVNKIGDEVYGFVGLANDFVSYAQIISIALNSMAGRFITISIHQEDYKSANEYFSSVFLANLILSCFFSILGSIVIIFLPSIINVPKIYTKDVQLLFTFMILNFIISILGSVFGISTFANNKLYLQSKRKIESYVIKALILIITYKFLKPYLYFVGIATLISTIYSTIIDIYYTKKFFSYLKIKKSNFKFEKIKTLLFAGVWNSISKISSLLSNGLDLIISNKFVGALGMSVLSLSKSLPVMILSVFSLLASVFSPDLTISYAKNDYKEMKRQLLRSIKILSIFACIPVMFLFVYGGVFYKLWIPNSDYNLVYLLSILASMGMIFALPFEGLWNIFTVTNKVKISSIVLIINSLLTIIIVMFLLPIFNDNSTIKLCIISGVSSIFSIVRNLTFLPMYGAKCIKENKLAFFPIILKYICSLLITIVLGFIIKMIVVPTSWITLIVCVAATALFSLIINLFIMLQSVERKEIFSQIKKIVYKG